MLDATLLPVLLAHAGHVDDLGGSHVPLPFLAGLAVVVGGFLPARAGDGVTAAVVLCSAAAGTIHAVVTPDHFHETVLFGLFFLAVTVWQMAVVVAALHRPTRGLWTSTAVGTIAVLGIWALSCTAGVPIGPHPWTPEPTGLLDLACAAYEAAIVAGCLRLRRTAPARLNAAAPAPAHSGVPFPLPSGKRTPVSAGGPAGRARPFRRSISAPQR